MSESIWRRRALRIAAGILILPLLGLILFVAARASGLDTPLVWLFVIAAALAWLIAYRAPTPVAAAFLVLPLLGYAGVFFLGSQVQDTFEEVGSHLDMAPSPESQAEAGPDLGAPSGGGGGGGVFPGILPTLKPTLPHDPLAAPLPEPSTDAASEGAGGSPAKPTLPDFPWPPPMASTSYVLPDKFFAGYRTVGEVAAAILAALEQNGYVERSFFRTEPGGVAMSRVSSASMTTARLWPRRNAGPPPPNHRRRRAA